MKKYLLFLLLLSCANALGQLQYESRTTNHCTSYENDNIECIRTPETTVFVIDIVQNKILQQQALQKTWYSIDSKTIPNEEETLIWNVHTATGERFKITVTTLFIRIQSLNDTDRYTQFEL